MDTAGIITLHEKKLVPGDYVHYEILYETDTYMGSPVVKHAPPLPLQVSGPQQPGGELVPKQGGVQFGADPHKETMTKLQGALGELLKGVKLEPNKEMLNRRDWR
jgi:hypothetical protein